MKEKKIKDIPRVVQRNNNKVNDLTIKHKKTAKILFFRIVVVVDVVVRKKKS